MPKTLAQIHADKQLTEAIARTIAAYDLLPDGHSMIDYLAVIEGANFTDEDEDGVPKESISLAFRDGFVRTSVAKGLVEMAKEALTSNYARAEEE